MANVTQRKGKDGSISYRIRVFSGVDLHGKQVFKSRTFVPEKGMSARQVEKALSKAVIEFEEEVRKGSLAGPDLTVDQYLQRWFNEYADKQLKKKTVEDYKSLMPRISAALGHIKLSALRPGHIMQFYDQLAQPGIRLDGKYKARQALFDAVPKGQRAALVRASGVSERTVAYLWSGKNVSLDTAQKVADAAGVAFSRAFSLVSKETLSGSSARHYHRLLSSALNRAVRWQLIEENPCTRVSPPKVETADVQFLDEHEIADLMAALDDAPVQYSVITQLALFTGARRGELCALRWSDVDFSAGLLSILRTAVEIPKVGVIFNEPKTKKSKRIIKLTPNAVQLLRDYKIWQSSEKYKIGSKWCDQIEIMGNVVENDLLFTRWDGRPIRPGAITSWFPKFLRVHNLPPVRFHSLRHSNAALLIAAHVPVTTVAGRLGHAQVSTTTNIYAGFIRASDAKAADALTDAFDRIATFQDKEDGQDLVKFSTKRDCTG